MQILSRGFGRVHKTTLFRLSGQQSAPNNTQTCLLKLYMLQYTNSDYQTASESIMQLKVTIQENSLTYLADFIDNPQGITGDIEYCSMVVAFTLLQSTRQMHIFTNYSRSIQLKILSTTCSERPSNSYINTLLHPQ